MGKIFYLILNMNIMSSVMGIFVLMIRKNKKWPRKIITAMWCIPFIRAVLPLAINGPFGLMDYLSRYVGRMVPCYKSTAFLTFSYMNFIEQTDSYHPFHFISPKLELLYMVLAVVWGIVTVCLMILWIWLYLDGKKNIKGAVYWKENIWFSGKVNGGATYGIVSAKILLPYSYNKQDLCYVVDHEKMHIKRKDNFWRLVGFAVVSVHWFNPLMWYFLKCFLLDIELACDEAVISDYNEAKRKKYAIALLNCKQVEKGMFISSFGGSLLQKRIQYILLYKQMTKKVVLCYMVIFCLFLYYFLTNAMA